MTMTAEQTLTEQESRLRRLFERIIPDDELHAGWLNVLSYLEYMGSRKIFKTQKQDHIDEALLRHASEEARHALVLKQMVEKILPGQKNSYEHEGLLCGFSAFRYFQSLDAMVKRGLSNGGESRDFSYRCYVYVSYIIEIRANWLYKIYSEELKKAGSSVSVNMIINDEIRHLEDMKEEIERTDPGYESRIEDFLKREERWFVRLIDNLEKSIEAAQATFGDSL